VVELPAVAPVEDLRSPPPAHLTSQGHPAHGREQDRPRVMVVDDNVDAADTLADLLADLGYQTRATYDAVSALELAGSFKPEVCFLDIGLPVMDGYELAQRLRQAEGGRARRLIAVTGYGQDSDRQRARQAGFDGQLVKPVSLDALETVLEPPPANGQ